MIVPVRVMMMTMAVIVIMSVVMQVRPAVGAARILAENQ